MDPQIRALKSYVVQRKLITGPDREMARWLKYIMNFMRLEQEYYLPESALAVFDYDLTPMYILVQENHPGSLEDHTSSTRLALILPTLRTAQVIPIIAW